MEITGIKWLGTRTDRFSETIGFYEDVMGLPVIRREADMVVFKLPDGDIVEVFGPGDEDHTFFTTGPVAGFAVADVDAARHRLEEHGIEFIGPVHEEAGMRWTHFRGPDGNVYELTR